MPMSSPKITRMLGLPDVAMPSLLLILDACADRLRVCADRRFSESRTGQRAVTNGPMSDACGRQNRERQGALPVSSITRPALRIDALKGSPVFIAPIFSRILGRSA